jgi:cysteine desulfurase/selenocysteine lyase
MISSLLDRADYPAFRESVYVNQASLGLIGQPAVTTMHAFIENVARHGNCYMSDSEETAYLGSLRKRAATMLHSNEGQIAVVAGASEILGQLPFLLQPKSGGTILAVSSDFPAITRPWLRQAAMRDYSMRFVDDNPEQDLTDALVDAVDERTAVVAVGSVQYATGTIVDISRLRQMTAQAGACLIVDATQAVGAMPVDANAWDADAVVASGYKWLGGHGGVGLAVMSPLLLEQIPPLPGWMGAPDPFAFDARSIQLADDARRYTQSTMSYVSVAGLTVSLDQLLSLGVHQIEEHARQLASILVDGSAGYGWKPFRPLGEPAASSHIISLAHSSNSIEEAAAALRSRNIVCSTRGGRIRISLAPYNDESDVDTVIEAFASVHAA